MVFLSYKDEQAKNLKEIQHHLKENKPPHNPLLKVSMCACPVTVFLAQFSIGFGFLDLLEDLEHLSARTESVHAALLKGLVV